MVNFQRTEPDKSRAPRRCKHLVSMAVDLHIAPDLCDPAVCADQNRRAKNSLEGPAIHGFLSPGPVSLQHLMLFVRNKRYGKPVLVSKGFLCLWRIGGNAQYRGPAFGEGARQPREIDGLPGTAGRVGARIEKQHELCSGIVGQRDGIAAVAGKAEGRRACPLGQSRLTGRRAFSGQRLFLRKRVPAAGFAKAVFDRAVPGSADFLGPDGFNCFDGALCDPFEEASWGRWPALLFDLLAAARRIFDGGVLANLIDGPRARLPDAEWGDFLRVFLDIRLPFVAFGGSIMGYCGVFSRQAGTGPAAGQV